MRRMKLVSVFLLVSLILLGGSVFSEVPEISLEEILKWTSAETNEDPYKRENMEVRGFYRDGEEYEDPQFYYFASSAASSREGDEPVEAVDGFYREGEEEEEYSIFISAFTSAPVDNIKVEAMKVFASTVNTLSGGDIYVRIFHTNNHGPEELLSGVINGMEVMAFDCSLCTIADLLFLPELSIFSAAYLFEDAEHMDKAMESGIMTELLDRAAANSGVRVLDNWYSGSHHLFLNETISGIEDPSQLEGLRLCSSCYQGSFDACKALGASPVYMGQSTLKDAMSCGSIQGAEMLLECVTAEECIDSIKTIILTGHQIESVNPTISEATWKRLSEEQRGWILEALHTARSYMETEVLAHEAEIIGELAQKYGVQVLIPCKDGLLQQAATYYSQNRFSAVWGEDAYVRMHSASEGM